MFEDCNLQPCDECTLPTSCGDQSFVCSWHLLGRPLRSKHNNVPFTGQMMSNSEEELKQEGQSKGKMTGEVDGLTKKKGTLSKKNVTEMMNISEKNHLIVTDFFIITIF